MIKYLSKSLVALNINGEKKTFLNSSINKKHLIELLPKDECDKIFSVWGNEPFIADESELQGKILEEIQNKTIEKMKKLCTDTITQGIDYNGEHYSFEITDQLNLSRLATQVKEGRQQVIYHADGQPCRLYSNEEILELNKLMEEFIEYHTTYFNSLKTYIKTLKYQSQILATYYGMEIPTMSVVLQTLIEQ